MTDYHRVHFRSAEEAAAFVAALSRFTASPNGKGFSPGPPEFEVLAVRNGGAGVEIILNGAALAETISGFAMPPGIERVGPDAIHGATSLLKRGSPAMGRDEAFRLLPPE